MRVLYASIALALVLDLGAASVHPPIHAADIIVIARGDGDKGGGHGGGRGGGRGDGGERGDGGGRGGDRDGGERGGGHTGGGKGGDGGKGDRGGGNGGAKGGSGGGGGDDDRNGGDADDDRGGGDQRSTDRGAGSGDSSGRAGATAGGLTGGGIGRRDASDEAVAIHARGRGWACNHGGALGCESATDTARSSGPPPSRSAADAAAYDRDIIRTVQESLRVLGFQPGPVDGILGPRTRLAVRSYQRENGLPEDGRLSDALVASILAAGTLAELERVP